MNKLKVLSTLWKVLKWTSPQIFLCPVKKNHLEILLFGHRLYLRSTGKRDFTLSLGISVANESLEWVSEALFEWGMKSLLEGGM